MPKSRKGKTRSVLPVFKMLCEGAKTEPQYINSYINHFHSEKRNVLLVPKTNKNTPVQLVEEAISEKQQGNAKDVIWVVYDRESVSKYPHSLHAKARKLADDHGIHIALSNVCFEYWLLLHFGYTTASYSSFDDLKNRSKLTEYIKSLGITSYDKSIPILFDKLKEFVPDAIENAANLKVHSLKSAEKGKDAPHHLNPYVDVHEMFQDMQCFVEGKPGIRS